MPDIAGMLLLKLLSAATWIAVGLLLVAPLWRLAHHRGRYLDPFWAVVALGIVNRLMFVGGAPIVLSYLAAILLACVLFAAVWSYQRADA